MLSKFLKAIAALLVVVLLIILLSSCGKAPQKMDKLGDQTKAPSTFMQVEEYLTFYTVVDTDTGVMYSISRGSYNSGTMTMLVNADGTPKLFPGFDAREDRS